MVENISGVSKTMNNITNKEDVSIVVIDSGIDVNSKVINKNNVVLLNECNDEVGHGTAVVSIIQRQISNAKIFVYKLFNDSNYVETEKLIDVLKFISETGNYDIIHLSCSVSNSTCIPELKKICDKISNSGTIIVSSYDNAGSVSYPSAFENVIGVDCNKLCGNGSRYIFVENSNVNILGTLSMQRLPTKNGETQNMVGSSFAAPYITGIIAKHIQQGIKGLENILYELKKNAWRTISNYPCKSLQDNTFELSKIKKAILFPFNKEMHSLVNYTNLLPFSIQGIYEPSFFRNNNRKVSDILSYGNSKLTIKSEKEIDWTDDFDTVILGHVGIMSAALNFDIIDKMLDYCIEHRKNIYAFDSLEKYQDKILKLRSLSCFAYYPKVEQDDVDRSFLGKLYKVSCPVVGVFGTSSKQGKFSLQLAIREKMQNIGYKVGGLGTEPSAPLFGFDKVYPMGYESSVKINGNDAIITLNRFMHEIDCKSNDIIIVGSQSQTVPVAMGNIALSPIEVHEFLIGTEPDAIVLCINPYDDLSIIKRSINYLESYLNNKVIALSLFPRIKDEQWIMQGVNSKILSTAEIEHRKSFYQEEFNIPCYSLGNDKDLDMLVDEIVNFFS